MNKPFWADQMCLCRHLKSEHAGALKCGACNYCVGCVRFTWAYYVDAKGKKIDAPRIKRVR